MRQDELPPPAEGVLQMSHFILSPKDTDALTDYIKAATSAIQVALGTLPLKSLDGIPEEVHYMFKEIDDVPAAPADDEATIAGLLAGMNRYAGSMRGFAIGAMEVIRRGEVHGLTTTDKVTISVDAEIMKTAQAFEKERDALKAEVERLRANEQRMARIYVQDMDDRQAKMDAAIARAEKDREQSINDRVAMQNVQLALAEERDTARAAHAEAHKLVVQWSEEARGPYPECDAYLAKYGKDASK